MIFFIVGLGMMGSSYAKKLTEKGYTVYGYDKCDSTNKEALEKGFVKSNKLEDLTKANYIILSLYPDDNVKFLHEHKALINPKAFITDISGIKSNMIIKIKKTIDNSYMSHHPMAGSEIKGIKGVNPNIFKGANFLIIDDNNNEDEINKLLILKEALEFGKVSITSKEVHDEMISFTSQLPHALAIALVNSDTYKDTKSFTGDSFRDLTRIASINESLWSLLFLKNKENLVKDLNNFKNELNKIIDSLNNNDEKTLKELMIKSKEKRDSY